MVNNFHIQPPFFVLNCLLIRIKELSSTFFITTSAVIHSPQMSQPHMLYFCRCSFPLNTAYAGNVYIYSSSFIAHDCLLLALSASQDISLVSRAAYSPHICCNVRYSPLSFFVHVVSLPDASDSNSLKYKTVKPLILKGFQKCRKKLALTY